MNLLDRQIILVTGKGGVGKTTVCAALGRYAASLGRRVLIAETSGSRRIPKIFDAPSAGYKPVLVDPGLHSLSITPEESIRDYVIQQIKVEKLYRMIFQNRVMGPLLDAVPGLHDVIQLGKVFDLAREEEDGRRAWDHIIVDAPATGHGLTMLASPQNMMDLTRAGPFFEGSKQVHDVVSNPELSAVVLVSLPEEMPVNETLDLWERMGVLRDQVRLCVLNEVHPRPFAHREDWAPARAMLMEHEGPGLAEAIRHTDAWWRRVDRQDAARKRLSTLPVAVVDLPFLYHRDLRVDEIAVLADRLAHAFENGVLP